MAESFADEQEERERKSISPEVWVKRVSFCYILNNIGRGTSLLPYTTQDNDTEDKQETQNTVNCGGAHL